MTDSNGGAISGGVTIEGQALNKYKKRKVKKELKRALKDLEREMIKELERK